ncbi:MAG TPA: hypothetical protein VJV78_11165, partial [Polyangiales bacterium]|nr:hypothetical protein [Polyangiales bacterium]
MFGKSLWCWSVCSAVLSVYAVGCSGEISPELLEVDDQGAALNEQWVRCAKDGQFCAFSGTRKVRYGRNSRYTIRTFTGGVQCNASTFGTSRRSNSHCDFDASVTQGAAGSAPSAGGAGAPAAAGSGGAGTAATPPAAGSGGAGTT